MRSKQLGVGLIEVLASLVVISVGVLGLMTLQTQTLRMAKEAEYYNLANFYAKDLLERMRANVVGVNQGYYDLTPSNTAPPACNSDKLCDSEELAAWDVFDWCASLRNGLGHNIGDTTNTYECSDFPAQVDVTPISASEQTVNNISFFRATVELSLDVMVTSITTADGQRVASDDTLTFVFTSEI